MWGKDVDVWERAFRHSYNLNQTMLTVLLEFKCQSKPQQRCWVLAIDQTPQLEKRREEAFVLRINQNKTRLEIDMNYQSNQNIIKMTE